MTPSPDVEVPDFDALYRADPDPWQVRSSFYERRKLEVVLACLGQARYRAAWDPASGTGELAARLAERCDQVLASDASAEAVRLTGQRCADRPGVEVRQLRLPAGPAEAPRFDLVVLAEWVYYLDHDDRSATVDRVDALAADVAEIVSLHWRHKPGDAYLSGAAVQTEITTRLAGHGWATQVHHEDVDFVLDVLTRKAVR